MIVSGQISCICLHMLMNNGFVILFMLVLSRPLILEKGILNDFVQ